MLRHNGRAELAGDLFLMWVNGTGPRTVDFTVFIANTRVTSPLLNPSLGATDTLLLVDEPMRNPNYGPPGFLNPPAPAPCPASQVCEKANVCRGRLATPNSLV